MKNKLLIIAIVAVIGFSMVTCKDDDNSSTQNGGGIQNGGGGGTGGGGGGNDSGGSGNASEQWRYKGSKTYRVTDGVVGSVSSEDVRNWITFRYTSDTNYEEKYTSTGTYYDSTLSSVSTTYHYNRNGQNYTINYEQTINTETDTSTITSSQSYIYDSAGNQLPSTYESTRTIIYTNGTSSSSSSRDIYDSPTGLVKENSSSSTNASGTTSTSEISYTIHLLSDSGGVKTYKYNMSSRISNGATVDVSTEDYSEYKFQDGKKLEEKKLTSAGVQKSRTTYTYTNDTTVRNSYDKDDNLFATYTSTTTKSDNPILSVKLGYRLNSIEFIHLLDPSVSYYTYNTVEILSDSATELVIRDKTFRNNVLNRQTDDTYIKVN